MEVVQPTDVVGVPRARAAQLLADEARHNLILGLAGTLRDEPGLYPEHELWLVEDAGAVVGAALRTPPYNLVLGDGCDAALEALAQRSGRRTSPAPSAPCRRSTASSPPAAVSTGSHRSRGCGRASTRSTSVRPASVRPPGAPREATAGRPRAARPLVGRVRRRGARRAPAGRGAEPRAASTTGSPPPATGSRSGSLGGRRRSPPSATAARPRPASRIGPRLHAACAPRPRLRERPHRARLRRSSSPPAASFCFLYTDLANPTSNKIYVAIGYRRVCDSIQYEFV